MPMPSMTPEPPPRPIRGLPPLRSVDRYPLPVGQRVRIPSGEATAVTSAIATAVQNGGFVWIEPRGADPLETSPAAPGETERYAERHVRRVPTHTGMRVSIGVLVGAGIGLGAIDGILVGGLLYTFPWFVGGLVGAGLLWWRYGRTYESEVISASFPGGATAADRLGDSVPRRAARSEVVWSAGRVRSVLFAGNRTAVGVVDCPIPLMEGLATVVHRFESEMGLPVPPPFSGTPRMPSPAAAS